MTPGTRTANNGNWRTAARWAEMLRATCKVIVQTEWDGKRADAMIALHALRSAASIAAFRSDRPKRGIALVLTGTDLYRDLGSSTDAARSLDLADRIVALQPEALALLSRKWRGKARVIYQSASALPKMTKPRAGLDCVAAGHLRMVKDPLTLFAAMEALPKELPIRMQHFGNALEPELGEAARALAASDKRYRYRGARAHGTVRRAIRKAHLLVHPSVMEGGANVIVEAVTAGTAVVASLIPGNIGMLGRDYRGYFEPGDAPGLARLLERALDEPAFLRRLETQCARRRKLFAPTAEAREVRRLVRELLA